MPVYSDLERLATWETLLRLVDSLLRRFERELQTEVDLPLTWYDVLVQLYRAPDHQLRMQTLAELVVLSRSGLTRLVDRLESAGLVRREPCREDRRGYYAILTEKGLGVYEEARIIHRRGVREHFVQHLTDEDIEALYTVVRKVRGDEATERDLAMFLQRKPQEV